MANEFEWKIKNMDHFDGSVNIDDKSRSRTKPCVISQFDIEITMLKRLTPYYKSHEGTTDWLERNPRLNDEAFRPKTYTVRLEKGYFLDAYGAATLKTHSTYRVPRYALRLLFDKSPYPPEQEWNSESWKPSAWEWKDFNGSKIVESDADKESWIWKAGRALKLIN